MNTIFSLHGDRCVFCGKLLDSEAILEGCKAKENELPALTNGTKPHAVSAFSYSSAVYEDRLIARSI